MSGYGADDNANLQTSGPLRADAEHNRRRILQAARDLFAAEGLEPNLNDIARQAGVGVGTVYRRFATKEDLLDAIFVDVLDQLVDSARDTLRQKDSWKAFTLLAEQICEITVNDRGLREIAFSIGCGTPRLCAARTALDAVLTEVVDRAKSTGQLRMVLSHNDLQIIRLLVGTVSDFAGQVQGQLWRSYVAIVLDGMRVPPGSDELAPDTG
jgi:AcrR family transcriptional regulator